VLLEQAERVAVRLREAGHLARTARIKVRFGNFSTITRQAPFLRPPTPTANCAWLPACSGNARPSGGRCA